MEIGGDERYMAVCRKCWRNKRIEQAQRAMLPLDNLDSDPSSDHAAVLDAAINHHGY